MRIEFDLPDENGNLTQIKQLGTLSNTVNHHPYFVCAVFSQSYLISLFYLFKFTISAPPIYKCGIKTLDFIVVSHELLPYSTKYSRAKLSRFSQFTPYPQMFFDKLSAEQYNLIQVMVTTVSFFPRMLLR